jgi:hypothetical protein
LSLRVALALILQKQLSMTGESLVDVGSLTTCAICLETFNLPVRLGCDHIFCNSCWDESRKRKPDCPMCRAPHAGKGAPDAVMKRLVATIPRRRPCGAIVARDNLEAHEQGCGVCASVTKKELKGMVNRLLHCVQYLDRQKNKADRDASRARDESSRHRQDSENVERILRDRDNRAERANRRRQRSARPY